MSRSEAGEGGDGVVELGKMVAIYGVQFSGRDPKDDSQYHEELKRLVLAN